MVNEEKIQDLKDFLSSSTLDGYEPSGAISKRFVQQASEKDINEQDIAAVVNHFSEK